MYDVSLANAYFPAQEDADIRHTTIGGLLREIARGSPHAPALVEVTQSGCVDRRWSYGDLLRDSERLAQALASRFSQGERVVVWAPNSPEWVLMEYACALAGLILVTANPAFQVKELRYVLEHSDAVALFTVGEFRGNPMARIANEAARGLSGIREIVDLNDEMALFRMARDAFELPLVSPVDAAQIQYTSGTTGFPKGAVLSHFGLVNNARFYAERCGVSASSTWFNIMPLFHTAGCGMVTLGCLQAGCAMVLVSLFDPRVINGLIETEKVSLILGVPTMVIALQDAYESSPVDVSSLRLVSCGGAMVAPELVRRVRNNFGCDFSTLYGQTEHCPVITQHHLDDTIEDICETAGQPIARTDVSIRRVDDNSVVALEEVGEICARGPCTMLAYYRNPQATRETIDDDGWLHTGDLGTLDQRGYLRITGRVKDMIIRGGENHFPAEIENILLEHESVAEVAVVGLPDDKWGEIIAAFIRLHAQASLDIEALHGHCRAHLAPQKSPVLWCQVDEFPMTGSGKIQKFKLRDGFLAGNFVVERR